jgi:UDP-glucose 4-epimerase
MRAFKTLSKPYRAMITGGSGFIGSHLAEALLERGHDVTVLDDLSTGCFDNIQHLVGDPHFRFAIDNVKNELVLDRLASECDVIFHLAAAVGVQLVVDQPVHTIETNIMGTETVLKVAQRYRAKVLIASTSEVYGKSNSASFDEEDDVVLGASSRCRWAYAASKMVDEFLGLAYHREKGLPVVIFRLFNTVGPRQTGRYGMVIPRLVGQALTGDPLTVYGDGRQTRCFLHVADAIEAIIRLTECRAALGKVFNVGSTEEVSILHLAHKILASVSSLGAADSSAPSADPSSWEKRIRMVPYDVAYKPGFEDMIRRVPNISKVHRYTGWQPSKSLEEIIRDVTAHLKSNELSDQPYYEYSIEA